MFTENLIIISICKNPSIKLPCLKAFSNKIINKIIRTTANEGDLIIPAEMADAAAVNFMAKYGRGLICLALDKDRVKKLGLPRMVHHNSSRHETAFTISIEAREGVTTGISAAAFSAGSGIANIVLRIGAGNSKLPDGCGAAKA